MSTSHSYARIFWWPWRFNLQENVFHTTGYHSANTIKTLPEKPLHAFYQHGALKLAMNKRISAADSMLDKILQANANIKALAAQSQHGGAQALVKLCQP